MKRSILIFSLITALLLTACGGGAAPTEAPVQQPAADGGTGNGGSGGGAPEPLGRQFAVDIGETIALEDGTTVKFDAVTEDSRCARDTECVSPGQVVVTLTVTIGGTPQQITVTQPNTGESVDTAVGNYNVEFISLRPQPRSDTPTNAAEYRVQLVVTKIS
jgi:hypothetical protein